MRFRIWSTGIALCLILCFVTAPATAVLDPTAMSDHRNSPSKRVIADGISAEDVRLYEAKGCVVKHRLENAVSFDCPEAVIPGLAVREARVYHILDLNADSQIGADLVWAQTINGTGVDVAVLDTGIDTDHPELKDSYRGGYDCVHDDGVPEDDHGHGTHVSGIITSDGESLGTTKGVAPGAGIYMYKVCDASGSCYDDDMQCGMERAVLTDAKVMSISIGGGSYTTENCDGDKLAAMVNDVVYNHHMTVVVAAGNDGRGVSSPGCASGAIAVGAVDSSDNVAYFSGRGLALDIVAPGVSIYSTYLNGGAATMSGTSMATPHVAGVVALLLQANPSLTTNEIKQALYSTADPVNRCYGCTRWVGSTCRSQGVVPCTAAITGAGVVDAYGAYAAVHPACTSDAECDNGLACDGIETCVSGTCKSGSPMDCSNLNNACNTGVCDETTNNCVSQPKADGTACGDGAYCNGMETCQAGGCVPGDAIFCNDNDACTDDTCDEAVDKCVYVPTGACSTLCWSGNYRYLYNAPGQADKFCLCAQGEYGAIRATQSSIKRTTAYRYADTGNNYLWNVISSSAKYPLQAITCKDGIPYPTNDDYYW
jgi:hypothetical protein